MGSENVSNLTIIINDSLLNDNHHLLKTSNMVGTKPNTFQAIISFIERHKRRDLKGQFLTKDEAQEEMRDLIQQTLPRIIPG